MIERRDFIKKTLTAGAGLMIAPTIAPASVFVSVSGQNAPSKGAQIEKVNGFPGIIISVTGTNMTILFAAQELKKYLRMMMPEAGDIKIDQFRLVIKKNLSCGVHIIARSWQYLDFHAGLVSKLAESFLANVEGDLEKGRKLWQDTVDYASRGEDSVQDAFDVFTFNHALRRKFNK